MGPPIQGHLTVIGYAGFVYKHMQRWKKEEYF